MTTDDQRAGPILLTGDGRVRLRDARMVRDHGDDNCEYFDTDQKTIRECCGDGHYRCNECKNLTPLEERWNPYGF